MNGDPHGARNQTAGNSGEPWELFDVLPPQPPNLTTPAGHRDWHGSCPLSQPAEVTLMLTNAIPTYSEADNETGCCPRFNPEPWNDRTLHFDDKLFVKASTKSVMHVPLNMGAVFSRTWKAIKDAQAANGNFLVLSHDDSPWQAEHLFAVTRPVPGAEMVHLSGDYLTKVFEGPFSNARTWCADMERYVIEKGRRLDTMYFFYTTCPRCAKHYGKNYVVGIAKVQ